MNLSQFEYFLALADTGSMKLASERLFVSQAAVSKQLSSFENELGITLFFRRYGAVTLTPQGEILLNAIKKSSRVFNDGLREAIDSSSSHATSFHVGVPEHAVIGNLINIFTQYGKDHPETFFYWDYNPITFLSLDDKTSNYDMVVVHEQMLKNHRNIEAITLLTSEHLCFISSTHPLAQKKDFAFKDLKKERFYVPAPTDNALSVEFCKYICLVNGFSPRSIVTLPNVESVLKAVEIGLGVAVLDDTLSYLQLKNVIRLPTGVKSDICLAWNVENRNPNIERIVRKIKKEFFV